MAGNRSFWLMKTEPSTFSIDDLARADRGVTGWDGVRNYQARNILRDLVRPGDGILIYHSSANPTGIAGEAVVVREGYPDDTAFDPSDPHYDPKSRPDRPTWFRVDVKFVRAAKSVIPLARLRNMPELKNMMLLKRGSRLSVQPVRPGEWRAIMKQPEWD